MVRRVGSDIFAWLCVSCGFLSGVRVAFYEPHFVVSMPELFYQIGGNLIEFDVFAWVEAFGTVFPMAFEGVSTEYENLEKQFRYAGYMARKIPVVFFREKTEVRFAGLETARTSEELPEALRPNREYAAAVKLVYTHLPEVAHVNYLIVNASPEFLRWLAEDLRGLGDALMDSGSLPEEAEELGLVEYYGFVGEYLCAKGTAMLCEADKRPMCSVVPPKPVLPPWTCIAKLPGRSLVFLQSMVEEMEPMVFTYLATVCAFVERVDGVVDNALITVDGGRRNIDECDLVQLARNAENKGVCRFSPAIIKLAGRSEEDYKVCCSYVNNFVIIGDYEKDTLNKCVDKALEAEGNKCINILLIPRSVFIPNIRDERAQTSYWFNLGLYYRQSFYNNLLDGMKIKDKASNIISNNDNNFEDLIRDLFGVPPFVVRVRDS